jgi:hypothetical protein
MQHILIRILTRDYDAWLKVHNEFAETRKTYGIMDGPVYRDIDDPNAALFHISAENLPRAMDWFKSQQFKEATIRAKVTGREFYLAERQS